MTFLYILLAHWIGDFVLQSRYIADRKSTDCFILLCHVFLYIGVLAATILLLGHDPAGMGKFLLVNFIAHLGTDAVTSRVTTKLYEGGHIYYLFTTIGFDQLLHTVVLFITYSLLL